MNQKELDQLDAILQGKPFEVRSRLIAWRKGLTVTEEVKVKTPRTSAQNRSLHLWLTQLAEEMDKNGFTVQNVTAKIQRAEIRPTGENLKEVLWRPYQIAATGKKSTTNLTKQEVDKIYEGLNKFVGENFEIHIPFPSDEQRAWEEMSGEKLGSHTNQRKESYPEYKGEPTI